MRILYILPNGTVKSGGNWVTAARLVEGLKKRRITVDIIEAKDVTNQSLAKYDVIHAFHAFKSFIEINHSIMHIDKAVVISFMGTDLKGLQETEENKEKIINLLNRTDAIILFHNEAREELVKEGIIRDRIKVIPQTTVPVEVGHRLKEEADEGLSSPNCITFILVGGIRKVKAPLEVIEMMSGLVEKIENIRLLVVGPILEKDLGKKFNEEIEGKLWVKYLGEVSHQEAQQIGKPILATNIS